MRQDPQAVMLFAAGFGTRMGALTKDCPKPLLRVADKTLLDHALELAQGIAPKTCVVNAHYKHEQITQHLSGSGVRVSIEAPDILDTGGGLRQALPLLGNGPVYTSNTDAVWQGPNPFELLKSAWNPDIMDALLLCVPQKNAVGYTRGGDFQLDQEGRLSRGPGTVYTGVQILKTDRLSTIEDESFSLNVVWDQIQKEARLFGLIYPGTWCDVGTPEGITLAEEMLENSHV
ncbi:nucleotidyltransferase family protein [Shimia sp. MMG029]|uniref:nucleotidyltransferase family protein n=1 Tax=Shimia sp. MMG029 TaxID=3021978 RepID=UPI0022FE1851|nr:nucleotidyltransferase family protein [Shimia sp. MMG029]MDA5557349.1 nucleotidyltransferase family protein [Shimia sp. MMG029]